LVENLLVKSCMEIISLARRSGQAVCGYDKVRAGLTKTSAALLLQARDHNGDGQRKMQLIARDIPVLLLLDANELGSAFGREEAVHVLLRQGGLADKLVLEIGRLSGFRSI